MIVDLKNTFLFGKPTEVREYPVPIEEVDLNKDNLSIEKIKANISTHNLNDVVFLDSLIDVSFSGVCDRCTKDVAGTLRFSLSRKVSLSKQTEFLDDEIILSSHKLDVDELIKSDVLSMFPDVVLCKKDCKGICPKCYVNLNDCTCDCDKKIIDPRLKILEDLL